MDRVEKLIKRAEEIFHKKFPDSLVLIQEQYTKDVYRNIIKAQYEKMLILAGRKEIVYFGISFLHSSLYDKSYEMLFMLLDKNFYLDLEPIEEYVYIPVFFEQYEENIKEIMEQLKKEAGHIQPFEENEIRRVGALYYYAAIYKLFRDLSVDMKDLKGDIVFFYGMYHGEAVCWTV